MNEAGDHELNDFGRRPPPQSVANQSSPHIRYPDGPSNPAIHDYATTNSKSDPTLTTNWNGPTLSHATGNAYSDANLQSMYAPGDPLPTRPTWGQRPSTFGWNLSGTQTPSEPDSDNDEYNWSTDEDLVKEIDAKYEEDLVGVAKIKKKRTFWSWRTLALWPVIKALATTFLGNMFLVAGLIVGGVVVHFYYRNTRDGEDVSGIYTADNAEAWIFWFAFNIAISWAFHFLVELLPRLVLSLITLVWGSVSEGVKSYLELFQTSKGWFKPILYAGCAWASFAVIFTSIFHLRDNNDPEHASRASYTFRVYQVIEVLFFAVLILCVEKFLILLISLNFHSVAYAERIKDNNRALSILDRLKDYRPRKSGRRAQRPAFGRGISNEKGGWHTPTLSGLLTPQPQGGGGTGFATPRPRSVRDSPADSDAEADNEGVGRRPGGRKAPFAGVGNWGRKRGDTVNTIGSQATGSSTPPGRYGSTTSSPQTSRQNTMTLPEVNKPAASTNNGNSNVVSGSTGLGHARNITIAETPAPERGGDGSGQHSGYTTPRPGLSRSSTGGSISLTDQPAAIAKVIAKKKVSAAEIARQAIKDPVATLGRGKGGLGLDITSPAEAKKLARSLFWAFRSDPNRAYLVTTDFYPAFKTVREAKDAFGLFDTDGNGDLTRTEIKSRVLQVYKERRILSRSLQDVGHVVGRLDHCFLAVGILVFAFVCLSVFSVNIGKSLTSFYSLGIAAAFIFKGFATNLFDSVIFLFVTHAYDTGDRIFLDDEVLVVKQIQLLATTFTKWDGTEMWIPNFKLAQKFITNIRRSGYQFENSTLQVGWDTSLETLDELEKLMNNWLQTDEKRMFEPSTCVVIQKMEYCRYMEITVGMLHRNNWQDWGGRWDRRTAFHMALAHYTNQLGITCYNSYQPIEYSQRELESLPEGPLSGEDDDEFPLSPLSPLPPGTEITSPGGTVFAETKEPSRSCLGFVPPEGASGRIRKRKLQSRKKAMRGEGAG